MEDRRECKDYTDEKRENAFHYFDSTKFWFLHDADKKLLERKKIDWIGYVASRVKIVKDNIIYIFTLQQFVELNNKWQEWVIK